MIGKITGRIDSRGPDHVLVEAGGLERPQVIRQARRAGGERARHARIVDIATPGTDVGVDCAP